MMQIKEIYMYLLNKNKIFLKKLFTIFIIIIILATTVSTNNQRM